MEKDFFEQSNNFDFIRAANLDPILMKHSENLSEWAYVTPEIRHQLPSEDDVCYVEDKTSRNSKM